MHWKKSDVHEAFDLFVALLKNGKLEKGDGNYYLSYQNPEVREILDELIEEKANLKIFLVEDVLYLVPNLENDIFGYTNEEMRNKLRLKNNKELYLAYFSMLVLLSKFYNSEDQSLSTRAYVTIEEIKNSNDKYIEEFQKMQKELEDIEELSKEYELDIEGIITVWKELAEFDEKAKEIRRTEKNTIGFLLKVFSFLEKDKLVIIREDREIEITEKMKQVISKYYFNNHRKEKIMNLLSKKAIKEEV